MKVSIHSRTCLYGIFAAAALFFAAGFFVQAQGPSSITYPISELGNCASQQECEAYCEAPENHESCVAFAVEAGLLPPEALEHVRRFQHIEQRVQEIKGPGGCTSPETCDAYCEDPDNHQECLDFAVREGYIDAEDAQEIREIEQGVEEEHHGGIDRQKAQQLIAEIGGPGGCSSMQECEAYCSDSSHAQQCMAYAREHGLMRAEDVERVEKHMEIMHRMEAGELDGPGGCSTPGECEAYCNDPSHMDECMDFAVEMGMMSPEAVEKMEEFRQRGEEMRMHVEEERERMEEEMERRRQEFESFEHPSESGETERFDHFPPPEHFEEMEPPEGFEDFPQPEEFQNRFEEGGFEYQHEYEEEPMSGNLFRQFGAVIVPLVKGLGL